MQVAVVKEFNFAKTSIFLSIIIVSLIICFVSLYMLTRSYSPNFSNKIGRYTGQPVSSESTFNKSGATMLSINNINGEDVEATIHSDSGLYGDGQLSGTISGNDPVMTLNGTITGYTGRYPLKSYTANIELQCKFPSQNQTECSYSLSPESDNSYGIRLITYRFEHQRKVHERSTSSVPQSLRHCTTGFRIN